MHRRVTALGLHKDNLGFHDCMLATKGRAVCLLCAGVLLVAECLSGLVCRHKWKPRQRRRETCLTSWWWMKPRSGWAKRAGSSATTRYPQHLLQCPSMHIYSGIKFRWQHCMHSEIECVHILCACLSHSVSMHCQQCE